MIGAIRKPNIAKKPANPDDYFDPNTHIATEANFVAFLEAGGKYNDKSLVGYKVQVSQTSGYYNNGIWIIADVNHDSINTGQINCYDLISEDCFYSGNFSTYQIASQYWRDSLLRTLLNDTFYNGFSDDFKNHINNIVYDSNGNTYNDDKVILPSYTEVNGITGTPTLMGTDFVVEGTAYPIFTDNNSRIKNQNGTATVGKLWVRSRNTGYSSNILVVFSDGSMNRDVYNRSYYLAPVLRVS